MSGTWSVDGTMPRWQFTLDIVVAGIFALILGGFIAAAQQWSWLVVVGLLALALALRHRQVWIMISLAVMAGLVQIFLTGVVYPADLAYAVLFFALGAHVRRKMRLIGLGFAVLTSMVAGVFTVFQIGSGEIAAIRLLGGLVFTMGTALLTVGGWTAGYIRWLNRRSMQADVDARLEAVERRRLQDAVDQEQERGRIATDMHDVVAHSWAVVAAQADGARYSIHDSPESAERALEVIGETARSAIADLRVILAQLRYQESTGTIPGAEQQRQLFARMHTSGMQINNTEIGVRNTSPLLVMTAYRLLSEALTNALKHGNLESPIEVWQDWSEGYQLRVINFLTDRHTESEAGHGITGMQERASAARGTVISRRVGQQWVLDAYLPDTSFHGTYHHEESQ